MTHTSHHLHVKIEYNSCKFLSLKPQVLFRHQYFRGWTHNTIHWMKLPSTTRFGFSRAYQLVHDFFLLWFYWYAPFLAMLHKQFEVLILGYTKVNCIKGTKFGLGHRQKKREFTKTEVCFHYLIIKMNDLGNTRFLEGSVAFPNSCN